jgi:hypothetical protein
MLILHNGYYSVIIYSFPQIVKPLRRKSLTLNLYSSGIIKPVDYKITNETFPYYSRWYNLSPKSYKINKKFRKELIAYFPWYDTGHIENDASSNSSVVACVFVTAVTFLPGRCLATIGVFFTEPLPMNDKGIFTEPLPSNDKGYQQTRTHTHTATWFHKPTLFFQNKESGLKTVTTFSNSHCNLLLRHNFLIPFVFALTPSWYFWVEEFKSSCWSHRW